MSLKTILKFILSASVALCSLCAIGQPRLPQGYFWKKLSNGLEVVVIENAKVPLVTVEIAVKNGAYTEGPEYSGLSHLFEHMFFKANKDYATQEKFLKRTRELGDIWNGTTGNERVNYYFTSVKDSLNGVLKLMNASVRFPIYREEDMVKERLVVDGEFQRNESSPYFQLYYEVNKLMWGDLITRKMPIGIHEIINTATPEKMMVIKDRYYVPNNSLLTICGDIKHEDAFRQAEELFGSWASSGFNPIEKFPIPDFNPIAKSEAFVKESTIAQTPYMLISWEGPAYAADSAGTVAADVFSTVLGLNSSKLQQALVDKGLASSISLSYPTSHYTGSISLFVEPVPEKLKECYTTLLAQLQQWGKPDYYTNEQLANAKAILKRNQSRNVEKPSSLPDQVSYNWCSTSLNYFTDLTENYQKVTRADIAKYISTYITGKPSIAGLIIDPEMNKQINAKAFFTAIK